MIGLKSKGEDARKNLSDIEKNNLDPRTIQIPLHGKGGCLFSALLQKVAVFIWVLCVVIFSQLLLHASYLHLNQVQTD